MVPSATTSPEPPTRTRSPDTVTWILLGSPKRVTLLDDGGGALRHRARHDEQGHERAGRSSGRGVFRDAHRRIEESRIGDCAGRVHGVGAVQIAALAACLRQRRREPWSIRCGPVNRRAIAHGNEQMRCAGRDYLRRLVGREIVFVEPQVGVKEPGSSCYLTPARRPASPDWASPGSSCCLRSSHRSGRKANGSE